MKRSSTIIQTHCFNCGTSVKGAFCHQCGQRVRDNNDRSLSRLLGEVFNNFFFFDNRFFLSTWYLLRFPGLMTVEFLEGKRKKFISPVTFFLFFNLIYFFVNPLTDYSISLYDQTYSQPYSELTKDWVHNELQKKGLDKRSNGVIYQNASDKVSKSIMILNIPMIAFFVYLMTFKRRVFYFDSLIFVAHFFSLFMFSWIMFDWVGLPILSLLGGKDSLVSTIIFTLFTIIIPLFYAVLSIKKFMSLRWLRAIPTGMGLMLAVFLVNLFYRFIVLIITFWTI